MDFSDNVYTLSTYVQKIFPQICMCPTKDNTNRCHPKCLPLTTETKISHCENEGY